jgi:hypothetical protein
VQIAKYLTADDSIVQDSNANDMRVTQDFNSFGEIIAHAQCSVDETNIYISCVPHKNNWEINWFTQHETDRFLNNHCQECVRAYLSIHDCVTGVFDLCLMTMVWLLF